MTDWSQKLPEEIWDHALENLVPYPGKLIPIESRASLSVESFQSALPQPREDLDAVGNFRRVCKKLTELGINRQFTRISTRFSMKSFDRLRGIAQRPHLAIAVKKFSYMVPLFHLQEESLFQELLDRVRAETEVLKRQRDERGRYPISRSARLRPSNDQLRSLINRSEDDQNTIKLIMERAAAQRQIIRRNIDGRSLICALKGFTQLQQIRLMRVQDQLDAKWAALLNTRQGLPRGFTVSAEWTLAWEHTSRSLSLAFLESGCPATRLSSRFMNPCTPLSFNNQLHAGVSRIASCLRSIELHFDHLDDKMLHLCQPLHAVLSAAVGLQGLHLGFGSLVTVPLESVFRNIEWTDLRYLGFHSWMLRSEDLIDLFLKHRRTLQAVRLRRVRLSEDDSWERVLKTIRLKLRKLKWISLREISYRRTGVSMPFGQMMNIQMPNVAMLNQAGGGNDNYDQRAWIRDRLEDAAGNGSRNEEESTPISVQHQSRAGSEVEFNGGNDDELASDSEDDNAEGKSHYYGVSVGDQDMLHHSTPTLDGRYSPSTSRCECAYGYAWEDLKGCNVREIQRAQWKKWELWTIKRCQMHDTLASFGT